MATPAALLLLSLATLRSAHAQQTLTAGGGISLDIVTASDELSYSVSVDGAVWLKSGPVAMTAGGVTYTSGAGSKHQLALSGTPSNSSGTDVSHPNSLRAILSRRRAAAAGAAGLFDLLKVRLRGSRRTGPTKKSPPAGSAAAGRWRQASAPTPPSPCCASAPSVRVCASPSPL